MYNHIHVSRTVLTSGIIMGLGPLCILLLYRLIGSYVQPRSLCVSQPHNIQVMMKNFSIDLNLPYSVVRNEQVEIRAILYNYWNSEVKVRVDWTYNENFCSLSTAKKKHCQEFNIQPSSSVDAPFVIVPLTLGEHDMEVKATGQYVSDGVKQKLKVVPGGRRLITVLKSVILEPEGKGGVQEELIKAIDPKDIVPDTRVDTIITIQGSPISEMLEKSIGGVNLNHSISSPDGYGEQNIMRMTAPLIATQYLDITNQWERVGLQRRKQAIEYIKNGIEQQSAFAKPGASYSVTKYGSPSTRLTAYVVKIFSLASSLVHVDKKSICDSVKWLILNKQSSDGRFREDAPVCHQDMAGGVHNGSAELDSSLTAFVLIAMLSSAPSCKDLVGSLPGSIEKAKQYLSDTYQSLTKPYSVAITSYALAKAGELKDTKSLMSASTDNNHWNEPGSRFLSLEATSYALLTLLKLKDFEKAGPLVKWIIEERDQGEVYRSTQSTMMQFEALAQYQIEVPSFKDLDMDVSFKLPGRSLSTTLHFNSTNALLARSEKTNELGDFNVTAKGKGQGTLTVLSVYQALGTEKECNNFDLSITIKDELNAEMPKGAKSTVSITICIRFLKNQDATMSIMDISMMTGFSPDMNDLKNLRGGVDRYISDFDTNKNSFDKSSLILYFDRISHTQEDCVKLNLHQYFDVGHIQPGSVTVYDYYSPENRCTKFYHLEEGSKLLGRICQGEVCRCAEENCFMQQQLEEVNAHIRTLKICERSLDYVFRATLTSTEKNDIYDINVMTIKTVLKIGTDIVVVNDKRKFISHTKCGKSLHLKIFQDYLIFGTKKDLRNMGSSGYSYMITKDTWIEMWPNEQECQKEEYFDLCEELDMFMEELEVPGCEK